MCGYNGTTTSNEAASSAVPGSVVDEFNFDAKAQLEIIRKDTFRQYFSQPKDNNNNSSLISVASTRRNLKSVGFSSITLEPREFSHVFGDINAYIRCQRSAVWVPMVESLPEAIKADFESQLEEAVIREWENLPEEQRESSLAMHRGTLFMYAKK